jgi:hypothetical protein
MNTNQEFGSHSVGITTRAINVKLEKLKSVLEGKKNT